MSARATAAGLLLSLALAPAVRADSPEELFERGNAAYERGQYGEAAEAYRGVLKYGIDDARVEYNLGNAAFKLGRIGEAILHYQRALRLDPTDRDIQANLDLARSRCFDRVETPEVAAPVRAIRSLQDRIGPDRQALLLLALYWAAAALLAWGLVRPGGWSPAKGWALAVLLVVAVAVSASWYSTHRRLKGAQMAVVLREAVEVLAGPGDVNPALFTVHEGLTLEVRSEQQGWVLVSLPNGLNGWVPRDAVGIV